MEQSACNPLYKRGDVIMFGDCMIAVTGVTEQVIYGFDWYLGVTYNILKEEWFKITKVSEHVVYLLGVMKPGEGNECVVG